MVVLVAMSLCDFWSSFIADFSKTFPQVFKHSTTSIKKLVMLVSHFSFGFFLTLYSPMISEEEAH